MTHFPNYFPFVGKPSTKASILDSFDVFFAVNEHRQLNDW